MRRALLPTLIVLAGGLLAGGCAPKDFSKEGANSEQFTADESQCRRQVRAQLSQQRDIDDQRRAVFSGERDRYGQQELYSDMANQGYKYSYERGMARCMEARGWQPKPSGPIPMPKLSW